MGVENKATGDSKLNDNPADNLSDQTQRNNMTHLIWKLLPQYMNLSPHMFQHTP